MIFNGESGGVGQSSRTAYKEKTKGLEDYSEGGSKNTSEPGRGGRNQVILMVTSLKSFKPPSPIFRAGGGVRKTR